MSVELLDEAWRAREADAPLESLTFTDEGLVLGAGTVLAAVDSATGPRRVKLDSDQRRLLALLSAAYARRVGPEVLPHIRRASTRWRDGETELAAVHLALTGLGRLSRVAARRLFAADLLMEAGAAPETIMKAMGLGICSPDLVRYRPDQPRVPPGSGRNSGQWTTEPGGGVPDAPTPRGYGVALINPATGNPVFFDDCQRRTGAMIEAKGPGTARVIEASQGRGFRSNVEARFLDQSARQLQAAGGRPVISFCAEKRTADYLRELFKERDEGRSKIVIAWVPFVGRQR